MYNFIDTTEASGVNVLPSEAFRINGEYIENAIPGYRTLSVSGREGLAPELSSYETGIRDGATLKGKRYPARTIIVKYQLIAENNGAFREKYNQLAGMLDVENAEIIFNDEADKYFVGTPSSIGPVEPGRNNVVGEFEIYCADPFKYSVEEYVVEATTVDALDDEGNVLTDDEGNTLKEKVFIVDYNGTYKSHPTLEADFYSENETSEDGESATPLTGDGDCGFVAFFTEEGKIIQLGDPEEADGEDFEPSQTLVNQSFNASAAWGTAVQGLWAQNVSVPMLNGLSQIGIFNIKQLTKKPADYYLTPKSWGSGSSWHGPTITRTIPADDTGEVGAPNFTLTYSQRMRINKTSELGSFHAVVASGSGSNRKILCGVNVSKGKSGKTATLEFIVNGAVVESQNIDITANNIYFGDDKAATKKKAAIKPVRTSIIKKSGETVSFNIGGIKKSFTNAEIAETKATEVTFAFGRYKTKSVLNKNGLYSAKFVKDNCTDWREVPNKFSTADIVTADCRTGEIKLNNAPTPEYGALGNDWEDFCLKPGTNQIGIAYSDWVLDDFAPTFKIRYREVFL